MTDEDIKPLIIDASTLIDFAGADAEILTIARARYGAIYVSSSVLADEIEHFDETDCSRLGIKVAEGTFEQIIEAQSREGTLSFYDWYGIILARDNDWMLLTNDGLQRRKALEIGVSVIRGFGLLITLVKEQVLDIERAHRTGALIHQANHWIKREVFEEFERLLDELRED